jgi:hypothetical protein
MRRGREKGKGFFLGETKDSNLLQRYFFRLVESKLTLMHGLVTSSSTSDMVAITLTRIVVVYPALTLRNLAYRRWRRTLEHERQSPQVLAEDEWPFNCQRFCRATPRFPRLGEGVGVLFWNGNIERARLSMTSNMSYAQRQLICKQLRHEAASDWEGDVWGPDGLALKILGVGDLLEDVASFKWCLSLSCPHAYHLSHRTDLR